MLNGWSPRAAEAKLEVRLDPRLLGERELGLPGVELAEACVFPNERALEAEGLLVELDRRHYVGHVDDHPSQSCLLCHAGMLAPSGGAVLEKTARRHAGQLAAVVAEVGLVGIAGDVGDLGQLGAVADACQRSAQPQDPGRAAWGRSRRGR